MKLSRLCLTFAILSLSACSSWLGDDEPPPLEGKRVSILEMQKNLEPDGAAKVTDAFVAPAMWKNDFYPQAGGYPNHAMQHLSLNTGVLKQLWSVNIGEGASKGLPLLAQPIVVDGRIFTLDTESRLCAFDAKTGRKIWEANVRDRQEDDPVIGGGISYSNGRLYATTGYDEILSLNPQDGKIVWRLALPSPSRAAPTVMDTRLFVTTLDNRLLALDAASGQLLWEYSGIDEATGLVGAASPAAARDIVIPAFSSGEIVALRVENGTAAWSDNLSSTVSGDSLTGISDIRALPVLDRGLVIAVSFGGKMVAIEERTGNRVWQRDIGGSETPWVVGNAVFVLSSDNELVALTRDTGAIRWVQRLAKFEDHDSREGAITWTAPIFAGGRLILVGTGGRMVEIAPDTGAILRKGSVGKTVTIAPVVAGDTLYLLADNGTLMAYK
jgi:outer membrane protein assembly factor BamB